jgi:hypothetical protein
MGGCCAPLAVALALLPYQTAARPCKRKQRAASCPSQWLRSTPTGEAPGSAAQRSAAARSHYNFQTMSRPAPLGRRESAVAACSVDLVRRVVQAGMASWLCPPSNRTKLSTKH